MMRMSKIMLKRKRNIYKMKPLFRCKKPHNPKYVGVLSAGKGDGTEMTRMDKLEETLQLLTANSDRASSKKGWKGFAWQRQRKGRKNV